MPDGMVQALLRTAPSAKTCPVRPAFLCTRKQHTHAVQATVRRAGAGLQQSECSRAL